ncbi:hypothetical protein [Nostoc favosum]|uniref:Response regulator n=1 Tax=Nostoc favosum CHAB5714 TaxID=2780399 RepID=A0ABS8I9A3_9NOSO|nr:hypothetical protein [Nostoc favosum]MCC5600758.1 hypothetical protein [Nostoc favosum CHAB5714]
MSATGYAYAQKKVQFLSDRNLQPVIFCTSSRDSDRHNGRSYSGFSCPGIAGVKENYQETVGNNYLFYLPDIEEIEQYFAGDRIYLIKICIDLDFLKTFIDGCFQSRKTNLSAC